MNNNIYNYDSDKIITGWVGTFNCSNCNHSIDTLDANAFTDIQCPECGSIENVPARFCNFLLLEILSTNRTRNIYRAWDESLDRPVIIKIMPAGFSADNEFIAEFRREARSIAKLNHNNIAQIYSFGVEKHQPYVVMEPINGEQLNKIIEENNGIPASTAIRICYDLALGLQAAADAGIVHENICPQNIILSKFGIPKITGFGLITVSHTVEQERTQADHRYISPEQIRKQQVEVRSNIYSLGAVLYHMLIGKPPFFDKNEIDIIVAHLEQCPVEVKELCPDITDIVSNTVKCMLQPNPDVRYPSYKSLLNDIGKAISVHDNKNDQKNKPQGRKPIIFKKAYINDKGHLKTGRSSKKAKHPAPIRIHHATETSKFVTQKKKHGEKKKTALNTRKYQLTKRRPSAIKAAATTHRHSTTDKNKERREQIRQQKRQKGRAIAAAFIFIALASVTAITFAYKRHQNIQSRIEFFAHKHADEISGNLFNQINENISTITNSISIATNMQNNIKTALLCIAGKPLPPQIACAANAAAEISVRPDKKSTENNNIDLPDNMNFDFEDEKLAEETSKSLIVDTNINKLTSIKMPLNTLRQNTKFIYLKAGKTDTSAKVRFLNSKLRKLQKQSSHYCCTATNMLAEIKNIYDEISEVSATHASEVEKRRQDAIEAERQRLEAIRLEKEQREYKALVKKELNQVNFDHMEVGTNSLLFASNDFKEIVNVLEEKFKDYRTEPGKKSAKIIIDRFKVMVQLKEEIIACINKHTFPWGWGHNLAARDIIKADEEGVYLKNVSHPWGSADVPQMLKYIDYYITLPNVKFTTKAQLALGGAVFCSEYGEKAKAKSEAFKAQALNYGIPSPKLNRLLILQDPNEEQ